jgi:hypothetical protein
MPESRIVHGSSTIEIRGCGGSDHGFEAILKPLDLEVECEKRLCFHY